MKIQAISASLPLVDWRVFQPAPVRIPQIDPSTLARDPFLKGFGRSGHRSTIRIPWRKEETVFFETNRGVKLPRQLPGTNPATTVLRRVYIAGCQVRFDFGLFAPMRPPQLRPVNYRAGARNWWSAPIQIRDRHLWRELPVADAAPALRNRFRDETQLHDAPRGDYHQHGDISILPQQLIVFGFLRKGEVPPQAIPVLEDPPLWLLCDSRTIKAQPQPDLTFVFSDDSVGRTMNLERFSLIRRFRRELIWLHADLFFLLEVGRALATRTCSCTSALLQTAERVAAGLSRLNSDEAWGFEPVFFTAWARAKTNQLALWHSQIGKSISSTVPLPDWLSSLPQPKAAATPRVYFPTLFDRLQHTRNLYPGDDSFQLGHVAFVEKGSLEGRTVEHYEEERISAFATYFGLPRQERKSISIVLPFRGGLFPLVACLESIAYQTLLVECPDDVELLIVEDARAGNAAPVLATSELSDSLERLGLAAHTRRFVVHCSLLELGSRCVARNIGLFKAKATNEIVMFLDASMVLDRHHLAEHIIRHHRIPNIALVGFKENVQLSEFTLEAFRRTFASLRREPDPRRDWKWRHEIVQDELDSHGQFRFRQHSFRKGEVINFMQLTNYLRDLTPDEQIGPRSLPTFFHTGISTVPADEARRVGGFHSKAFKDNFWGLEDSHLGALLLAAGVYIVPCPSATAFKIEHPESVAKQEFQLPRHRQLYDELLGEHMWQRGREAEEEIESLERVGRLREVGA